MDLVIPPGAGILGPGSYCAVVGAELVSAWLGDGFHLQLEAVAQLFGTVSQIRIDPEPPKNEIYLKK